MNKRNWHKAPCSEAFVGSANQIESEQHLDSVTLPCRVNIVDGFFFLE